jgi:hypothetical protein
MQQFFKWNLLDLHFIIQFANHYVVIILQKYISNFPLVDNLSLSKLSLLHVSNVDPSIWLFLLNKPSTPRSWHWSSEQGEALVLTLFEFFSTSTFLSDKDQ